MGYNLRAEFRGETDSGCTHYIVRFVPTIQQHWPWLDVELAGDSPVVVQYETTESPFEPIMKSRCSINVVANEYFFDLYGEDIQHTLVMLTIIDDDNGTETIEWIGFLTNNLLNQPQDGCEETFTLEAIDCLSTLEYFDYAPINGKKQIVTFQQILADLMTSCSMIDKLYVDTSIKNSGNTAIHMDELTISEQNFFSSDTDEPWNKLEVLEELCRFCGYTAFQWKNNVYLFDRQAHTNREWSTTGDNMTQYFAQVSSGDFSTYINTSDYYRCCTVTKDNIRGTGADISLKTIFNKVTVKDSFYEIGDFIPDIYEEDYLHNTFGEMWEFQKLPYVSPAKPYYVNKRNTRKEDADDTTKNYYQRQFQHDWYSSIYRNMSTLADETVPDLLWFCIFMNKILNDHGQVTGIRYKVRVYNKTDEAKEVTVSVNSLSLSSSQTKTIEPHYFQEYLVELYHPSEGILPSPTYSIGDYGPFPVNDSTKTYTRDYIGGTIVDLAEVQKADDTQYNYEIESDVNFDRYLLIAQADKPENYHCNPRDTGMTPSNLNTYFQSILELNSGWTKPIIIDDKCYLTINASAIFERYTSRDYINSDWTNDCTGLDGDYNVYVWNNFNGSKEVFTCPPALVFKLKIGDYYWNGSGWTTTDTPFYVNLHTPTDDDGLIDFSAWWNKEHNVINNVSWTDWAGVDGYKIPLTGVTFDFNSDIEFEFRLPGKIQVYIGNKTHDGMNSYCWIKDFKLNFATKGSENYDLSDVVYENVIDDYSVNTLSDITLRFTTYPGEGLHSYSNVGYNGTLIDTCIKDGLDGVANKMEENIIKAYVNQYNTNTIEQTLILDLHATPMSRVKDTDNGKYFHVVGQQIDYAMGRQTVNLIESKKWSQVEE